jgi:hypothetical protein
MSSERLWIDGRWVASAGNQTIPVINPVSGETISQSADATAGDVACFGMAGADMPHDFDQLNASLPQLGLECPFTVRNDVISILRAGG